jgi:hypothetical protein
MDDNKQHDLYPIAAEFFWDLPKSTRKKLRNKNRVQTLSAFFCGFIFITVILYFCISIYINFISRGIYDIPLPYNETAPALIIFILLIILAAIFIGAFAYGLRFYWTIGDDSSFFEKSFFPFLKGLGLYKEYVNAWIRKESSYSKEKVKIVWKDIVSVQLSKRKVLIGEVEPVSIKTHCIELFLRDPTKYDTTPYIMVGSRLISGSPTLLGYIIRDFCNALISS